MKINKKLLPILLLLCIIPVIATTISVMQPINSGNFNITYIDSGINESLYFSIPKASYVNTATFDVTGYTGELDEVITWNTSIGSCSITNTEKGYDTLWTPDNYGNYQYWFNLGSCTGFGYENVSTGGGTDFNWTLRHMSSTVSGNISLTVDCWNYSSSAWTQIFKKTGIYAWRNDSVVVPSSCIDATKVLQIRNNVTLNEQGQAETAEFGYQEGAIINIAPKNPYVKIGDYNHSSFETNNDGWGLFSDSGTSINRSTAWASNGLWSIARVGEDNSATLWKNINIDDYDKVIFDINLLQDASDFKVMYRTGVNCSVGNELPYGATLYNGSNLGVQLNQEVDLDTYSGSGCFGFYFNWNVFGGGTNAQGYIDNIYLINSSENIWNYSGKFTSSETIVDFSDTLNNAINDGACDCAGCTISGTNCNITTLFYSGSAGTLGFNNFDIRYFASHQIAENYSNGLVLETSQQSFNSTFEFASGENLVVYLVYDGSRYLATKVSSSTTTATYGRNIIIPLVSDGDSQNKTFYWEVTDSMGTYNTSSTDQTVYRIYLRDCNATISMSGINFTILDENTGASINANLRSDWEFWEESGDGSISRNYSVLETGASVYDYCIYPNSSELTVLTELSYDATDYSPRSYYLVNSDITNQSQNINLYLPNDTESLEWQIVVEDLLGDAVTETYIKVLRYFVDEGISKTIAILKTDSSGKDLVNLLMTNEQYQYIVENSSGSVLYSGLPSKPYCPGSVVGEQCVRVITVGTASSSLLSSYGDFDGFSDSLVYYNATNLVVYTWSDTSGLVNSARLLVTQGSTTICDQTVESAAGVITCDISAYKTSEIRAEVYISRSPEVIWDILNIFDETFSQWFTFTGSTGLILTMLLISFMFFIGAFYGNPLIAGMFIVFGLFLSYTLGLFYGGSTIVYGMIATIIIIIWRFKGK